MDTPNKDLAAKALESLKGKWGLAIGTFVIYILIITVLSVIPFIGMIGVLIIGGPLVVGAVIFTQKIARNEEAKLEQLFEGFNNFGTALGAYLLVAIFVILWSLLLIVPGIIMAIAYSQTFFIIADDNEIGAMDAIRKSVKMMNGYKMKFFLFYLRFFLWSLLCILTLGIGLLWLAPYMYVSYANFHNDIKDRELPV